MSVSDNLAFKRLEVCDVFTPERIAVFERPHEGDEIVVINIDGKVKVIGDVMVNAVRPPLAIAPEGSKS